MNFYDETNVNEVRKTFEIHNVNLLICALLNFIFILLHLSEMLIIIIDTFYIIFAFLVFISKYFRGGKK